MSLEVPSAFLDQGIFASDIVDALIVHDVCHLNHYAVRSFQEYQLKQSRGNGWDIVSTNKPAYPDDYFISRDRKEEKDSAISDKYSSKLQGAIQSYDSKIVELSEFVQSRAIKSRAAQTN